MNNYWSEIEMLESKLEKLKKQMDAQIQNCYWYWCWCFCFNEDNIL